MRRLSSFKSSERKNRKLVAINPHNRRNNGGGRCDGQFPYGELIGGMRCAIVLLSDCEIQQNKRIVSFLRLGRKCVGETVENGQNYSMANNQDASAKNEDDPTPTPINPSIRSDENHACRMEQLNRVRRRLDFGFHDSEDPNQASEDPNQSSAGLYLPPEVTEKERQRAREEWNFDFENEVPLEGDWVWERVPVAPPETTQVVSTLKEKHVDNRSV
ncbi:hypothetical protein JTB14_036229 [Gonioctena quinquepunctata]|nr:hypothetical protein JTB14_036229 [Gonioctena quinquepunctata]